MKVLALSPIRIICRLYKLRLLYAPVYIGCCSSNLLHSTGQTSWAKLIENLSSLTYYYFFWKYNNNNYKFTSHLFSLFSLVFGDLNVNQYYEVAFITNLKMVLRLFQCMTKPSSKATAFCWSTAIWIQRMLHLMSDAIWSINLPTA
jgi:hypothetical protein